MATPRIPRLKKPAYIGFRGTEQYRRKLQREAWRRGLKVQGLLERAVEQFLSSDKPSLPQESK